VSFASRQVDLSQVPNPSHPGVLPGLTFWALEGARFAVILSSGQGRALERIAARTRSRASRTAASGSPTMVKPGRPFETWTSTETGLPTAPFRVAEATAASMQGNGRGAWVPSAYMFPRRIDRTGVPQSGTMGTPTTRPHLLGMSRF
jgi:hypothetical protein